MINVQYRCDFRDSSECSHRTANYIALTERQVTGQDNSNALINGKLAQWFDRATKLSEGLVEGVGDNVVEERIKHHQIYVTDKLTAQTAKIPREMPNRQSKSISFRLY